MNTAMSSKRVATSGRIAFATSTTTSEIHTFLVALVAGVLVLFIGIQANVTALMFVGFLATTCSGLALNSMFWARYFEKHKTGFSTRRFPYGQ